MLTQAAVENYFDGKTTLLDNVTLTLWLDVGMTIIFFDGWNDVTERQFHDTVQLWIL